MKVVIDTNVFISGIFWKNNYSSIILQAWKNNSFELICSIEIIEEIINTLNNFKIKLPDEIILSWKKYLLNNTTIVTPRKKLRIVKEDPDDDKFIEAAIEGIATIIITQDKHLLKIKEFEGIKIMKPKEFIDLFIELL